MLKDVARKQTAWPILNELNKKLEWNCKVNNQELSMTWPNGSVIYLFGADKGSADSYFRGSKWTGVHVDECQEFRFVNMHRLIFESIKPSLSDYRGYLFLTGTPGPARGGFFYDVMVAGAHPIFKTFTADAFKNPYTSKELSRTIQEYRDAGIDIETTPWIQREYFAQWVEDDRLRVISLNPSINYTREWVPHEEDKYILGIDLAFSGVSAYVVGVENRVTHPNTLIYVEAKAIGNMKLSEHAELIDKYRKRYKNLLIVGDTGGLGRKIVDDLQISYGIPIIAAHKTDKRANELRLNSEAQVGRIRIYNSDDPDNPQNSELSRQWNELQKVWKRGTSFDSEGNALYSAADEWETGEPRHLHDAALYVRNQSTVSYHEPKTIRAPLTEAQRMRRQAMRRSREVARQNPQRWR